MSGKISIQNFSIDRFRQGDRDEFRKVYNTYYEVLFVFVYRIINEKTETQDILQESFIKLWRSRETFTSPDHIRNFLFLVSRNAGIDYLRSIRTQLKTLGHLEKSADETETRNEMITAEVLAELAKKIRKLPDKCRRIFELLYYEDLSTSEVALQLGISNQNVLNQKARAIKLLRSFISNEKQ